MPIDNRTRAARTRRRARSIPAGMRHLVEAPILPDFSPDAVAALLGEPCLQLTHDTAGAPCLLVDGRVHLPSTMWLYRLARGRTSPATARRYAVALQDWLDFLLNYFGLVWTGDADDALFAATEEHFAAYWRLRQFGKWDGKSVPGEKFSAAGWRNARKTLARFYRDHRDRFGLPMPFALVRKGRPGGWSGWGIDGYDPVVRTIRSAGVPLTPYYVEALLMGLSRTDLNGVQAAYACPDRDTAIASLAVGTGMRRKNLAYITVHELPPRSDAELGTVGVADLITKNRAGGDAFVFNHRMPAVWRYVDGEREDQAKRGHRPSRPLHVLHADRRGFRFEDPEQPGEVQSMTWDECTAEERLRLVQDGRSPVLFLADGKGSPMSYSSMQHVVANAAEFVREHIDATFPDKFRLHDLRHTYAVHLALVTYTGRLAGAIPAENRDQWVTDRVHEAVAIVQNSLGHASEASTRLYVSTVVQFLDIDPDLFLGWTA